MSKEQIAATSIRFRSAISWPLAFFVFGVLGSVLIVMLLQGVWLGLVLVMLALVFVLHMYATTYYVITANKLTIRCGFFYWREIPINQIFSVKSSRDLTSAPALSLRRLALRHQRGEVLISPLHPQLFVEALRDRGAPIGQ